MKSKIKTCLKKYRLMLFGYVPTAFCIFSLAFTVLKFPDIAAQGVQNGIDLSLNILIPSLFPFMVISSLFVMSGMCRKTERVFSKTSYKLLKLPGTSMSAYIISVLGGYPVGAKSVEELYEQGSISSFEGQKMLLFCVNPAPSFVIGTVGYFMLGKRELGLVIYISVILSSLIVGVLTRFWQTDETYIARKNALESSLEPADAFTKSVKQSAVNMLMICAFVCVFSCINELLDLLAVSSNTKLFFRCILEVTNGCMSASGVLPVPVIAAIISFGGICTHCQIMSTLLKLRLNLKVFYASRIVSACFSALICHGILAVVPISYETFATGARPEKIAPSYSVWVSLGLFLLTVLFILGDNFVVERKKIKDKIKG